MSLEKVSIFGIFDCLVSELVVFIKILQSSYNSNLSSLSSKVDGMNLSTTSTAVSGTTSYSGFHVDQVYQSGYPESYGNVIRLGGLGQCELFIAWSGTSGSTAGMYFRNRRDVAGAEWSKWQKVTTTVV